ncbi:glycoside hydrolase TIM-barrel-like domain-containing protein, partial [Jhaorihella thermophila]
MTGLYASQADRDAQNRTPITDGDYGEDWIWRFKRSAPCGGSPITTGRAGMRLGIATQGAELLGWNPIGSGRHALRPAAAAI